MKKCFYILFIFCLATANVLGQDIHFSQSFVSPLTMNPAATGNMKGDFRANCNYKDQWRSISNVYKTIFASADVVTVRKKKNAGFMGTGLSFYNDKSGKSKMGTTQVNLLVSYTVKLNKENFFGAGLQFGYVQKSVNANGLKWDEQYNGTNYDPTLPTGETENFQKVSYIDFAGGLQWSYYPDDDNSVKIGAAMYHVNKPNQGFSKIDKDPLNAKIIVNGSGEFKIGEKRTSVVPMVVFSNQGKLNELNVGASLKYGLGLDSKYTGANKSSDISIGALYRAKDAIILLFGMDYKKMLSVGLSYDINVSGLTSASKGRGGLELSLAYVGFFNKENKK